jgi:hypothetical protein
LKKVMLGAHGDFQRETGFSEPVLRRSFLGVLGLLSGSLTVKETAGLLHLVDDTRSSPRIFSKQFYVTLTYVLKKTGMKLTKDSQRVLGSLCRGQQVLVEKLELKYVDRAALSGICVLLGLMETLIDDNEKCISFSIVDWLSFVGPLVGMDHALAIKRLKYVTSYWYAKFLHDQVPEKDCPEWDNWLFSGGVRRYLRSRMISCSAKNCKLFYSLLQAKRSCDPVPDTFVQGALEKHRKTIGRKSAPISLEIKSKIEERTREIISTWPSFSDRQCEPSHSASFEKSRAHGGQHVTLMEEMGDCETSKDLSGVCTAFQQADGTTLSTEFAKVLKSFVEPKPDRLIGMVESTPGVVSERRGWLEPSRSAMLFAAYVHEEGLESILIPGGTHVVDDDELGKRTEDGCYTARVYPRGQMTAGVSAVLEPLKVRTVTKGRAQAYNAVHGIQKWMHSSLRGNRIFQLIGHTVDEDIIKEQLRLRKSGEMLISGDYSAATDNLKIEVTKTIFEVILQRIAEDLDWSEESHQLVILARKVLYEHLIRYPLDSGLEPVLQGTGQLMGSVLSFPILCIANCICCWISLFDGVSFDELPILVNGDDIAFSCTRARYKIWSDGLADFGFVKSVGKNYCHKRFMIINSELYDSEYLRTGRCHLPYFSSGLLMGQHRVSKVSPMTVFDEDEVPELPIITTIDLVLRSACNKERALGRFIHYNLDAVKEVTGSLLNLFLPRSRGGLGIESHGVKNHISLWQRRYATYLDHQNVQKLACYKRDACEAKQYLPISKVRCDPWSVDPDLRLCAKLSAVAHNFWQCSKEKLDEIRREGPVGWRVADPKGETKWMTKLSGSTVRAVGRCAPMVGDLSSQLHFRYTVSYNGPRQLDVSPVENGSHLSSPTWWGDFVSGALVEAARNLK